MGKNKLLFFKTKTYIHNEQICLASLSPEHILNFNAEVGNPVELKIHLIIPNLFQSLPNFILLVLDITILNGIYVFIFSFHFDLCREYLTFVSTSTLANSLF